MPVTPLSTPPIPANGDVYRAMFVWVTATASQDPLDTGRDQQALITFCGTQKVNLLYLNIRQYISLGSFNATKQTRIRNFLHAAHKSGIKVMALGGNLDWAVNQHWVGRNVLGELAQFNAMGASASHQFDGFCFDVEYWQDEATYPPATNLPGLCELVKNAKKVLGLGTMVGVFSTFAFKDNTGVRPTVLYNGKWAQDGEHLMDVCDFVVVGAYRNTAEENLGNGQPGQIQLMQPWYDYAVNNQNKVAALFCGTETIVVTPSYITYAGMTKAAMEAQQTLVSAAFSPTSNLAFHGIAVHSYDGWKAMS